MFKSRHKVKYVQQKEALETASVAAAAPMASVSNAPPQTTNKILAMLDNMLPVTIRHTKLPNESASMLSLVSDSDNRNHTTATNNGVLNVNKISYKNRLIQSPKNICKAIARTLTINKNSSSAANNNNISNQQNNEETSEQHLFETNHIEDIQATSILRSLMQSYSMQTMSSNNNSNNVAGADHVEVDEDNASIRSIGAGSCNNYIEFDEHDEYDNNDEVDENNATFLVNIEDDEANIQDAPLTFLSSAANRAHLETDLNIHNKKRKINDSFLNSEIHYSSNEEQINNKKLNQLNENNQRIDNKDFGFNQANNLDSSNKSLSEEELHFLMLQRFYNSDLVGLVLKYEDYRSKLNEILLKDGDTNK